MIKDIEQQNENIKINDTEIQVLKEYFPSCFLADGSFDVVKLQEQLKDKVDIIHEGYELKFLGKSYAKLLVSIGTTTIIKPDTEHNDKPENINSENIYISGDNLDGLKHLLKSYAKQVKCIYIDPPYNTGGDGFVYKDNFNFTADELQKKLSIDETQAKRIIDLTKRNSASHSAWLLFMYSRLQLARDLLTNDGVIFISIDDNEQANLKLLCDDIFGEENFVEIFSWNKTSTPPALSTKSRKTIEYVLCYEKSKNNKRYYSEPLDGGDQPLLNDGNNIAKLKFSKEKVFFKIKDGKYPKGKYARINLLNDIEIQNGLSLNDFELEARFKWQQKFLDEEIKNGTTFIIKSEKFAIRFQRTGDDGFKTPTNLIKDKYTSSLINKKENNVGTNETASSELEDLLGGKYFDFPKPISLIKYLLDFIIGEDDIILDFFGGSGTTAHSVLELNKIDEGNRKFIIVQLPEELNLKKPQQKLAYDFLASINRPHTLDQIGIERIIRAAKKIKEESKADIDYGFKHFELCEVNSNTLDKVETFDKAALIADTSILDDFGTSSILTTWLVNDGYGFNAEVKTIDLKGYTAYYCNKHLYLINPNLSQDNVADLFEKYDSIADFNPENIILFGYSFNEWSVTDMLEKNLKVLNDGEKNLKINIDVRY